MTTAISDVDDFLGVTDIPRDRWGRPLIKPPGGGRSVAYTRCTTFVGCLEDTYNLSKWQQRMVALGLARRPDLLLAVSAHHDDKDRLNALCQEATEAAAASSAATTGTALHRLAERLDQGETVDIPTAAKADLDAYRAATAGMQWLHVERMTVNDTLKVAGTPDRIGLTPTGGLPVIADLKTGSIDYGIGKIAMQLALYAHSDLYDHDTGTREHVDVDQQRALVIHLPAGAGRCELVWVDIAAGWEAVQLAKQVREWRNRKNLTTPYDAGDALPALIAACSSVDELTALWRAHVTSWTDTHSRLAAARKASLT